MTATTNMRLIEMTKEITVAKMSNSGLSVCKEGGERTAAFMEEIYNKLVELYEKVN